MERLCLFVLIMRCAVTIATNPGLKLQLSEHGLNYAASVAIDQLASDVRKFSIPSQHGGKGMYSYDLSGLRITGFTRPESTIVVNPGDGITWSLRNAGVRGMGDWGYTLNVLFKIRDHGGFDIRVSDVSMQVSISLGRDAGGRPTITSRRCSCDIGRVDIEVHGGLSWLYDLFTGLLEDPIKRALQSTICNSVNKAINVDAKRTLANMKVRIPVGNFITVDYKLVEPPVFGDNYIESFHKGEFFWTAHQTDAPFSPRPMRSVSHAQKMVTICLSDYVSNSLGYALLKYGSQFMEYTLTTKDFPKEHRHNLDTSIIPQLAKKYPNGSIELHLRFTAAPKLETTRGAIYGRLQGLSDVKVRLPSGIIVEAFTANLAANVSVAVRMSGDKITASVRHFRLVPQVTFTKIGALPFPVVNFMFNFAAKQFIIPKLNEVGKTGIAVPGVDSIQFTEPQLSLLQGAVCFGTNVKYTP